MAKRDLVPDVLVVLLTIGVVGIGLIAVVLGGLSARLPPGSASSSHGAGTVASSVPSERTLSQAEALLLEADDPTAATYASQVLMLEREMAGAEVIAEVEVAEVYSPTFHTDSGLPPTRSVPPNESWNPICEAEFYVPVRLRVIEFFRTDKGTPDGYLIAEYGGTIADYEAALAGSPRRLLDPDEVTPGDRGLAALYNLPPEGYGICSAITPILPRLEQVAERLQSANGDYAVGYFLGEWWPYSGSLARNAEHPARSMPVEKLRAALRQTITTPTK